MDKVTHLLAPTLRQLKRPEAALAWLNSSWATVVGKALAGHIRPMSCQNGCLEIAADSKAWQQQLAEIEREFCERINCAWGGNLVTQVKFIAKKPGVKRVPREIDNEHTPFVRKRR
jgi:predicted nucleic acid-binding Zn ribbon protein